jgi:hypothetical protein
MMMRVAFLCAVITAAAAAQPRAADTDEGLPLCTTAATYTLLGSFAYNLEHHVWVPLQAYVESWFDSIFLFPASVTRQSGSFRECKDEQQLGPYDSLGVLVKTYARRELWYISAHLKPQFKSPAAAARLARCTMLRAWWWVVFAAVFLLLLLGITCSCCVCSVCCRVCRHGDYY